MLYTYLCGEHGPFDELRCVAKRDFSAYCPECTLGCPRVMSVPFSWNWGKAGPPTQSNLQAIENRHRGNVSEEIKARHSR